jgi:hypothetical protein
MATATTTAEKTLPFPTPANSGQYGEDLDAYLDAPLTPANEAVTSAWVQAESPTFPGYNGLGTELDLPGAVPNPENSAVYDYPSLEEGLQAAADMMLGISPQTTPLATQFVTDLRSGTASEQQLTADILNSGWDGSGGDSYDASTIASELNEPNFSVAGSSGSGASTTGISLNPLKDVEDVLGSSVSSAASGLLGTIGIFVLKGIISLVGGGLFIYGAKIATERGPAKSNAASAAGGATSQAAGSAKEGAEGIADAFPEVVAA